VPSTSKPAPDGFTNMDARIVDEQRDPAGRSIRFDIACPTDGTGGGVTHLEADPLTVTTTLDGAACPGWEPSSIADVALHGPGAVEQREGREALGRFRRRLADCPTCWTRPSTRQPSTSDRRSKPTTAVPGMTPTTSSTRATVGTPIGRARTLGPRSSRDRRSAPVPVSWAWLTWPVTTSAPGVNHDHHTRRRHLQQRPGFLGRHPGVSLNVPRALRRGQS
jgi:hypothetical protein